MPTHPSEQRRPGAGNTNRPAASPRRRSAARGWRHTIAFAFLASMGGAFPGVASELRVGWHELHSTIASPGDSVVLLPDVILVRDSVFVWLDSLPLTPGRDFTVNYLERKVILNEAWPKGVIATVRYRALPAAWPVRQAWMVPGPSPGDTSRTRPPPLSVAARPSTPQPAGDLRIGGSKTFAIQVGSNRDLTLEQSLRVSINGTVGEDVQVTAELSDQNLPIQPEGTTEDIREIDKVLVEVKSPHYRAVLGNYDVSYERGEFGRFKRRLDGAQVESRFERWGVTAGIASTRGRFRSLQLPDLIDGNQGPYRLTDDAGNPGVIVIAGTERVWIDGGLQRRGQNNDYTMDYAAGEITFTRKRLIFQTMRIVIDYEFAGEEYARSSALASGSISPRVARWETSVFFVQEGDNENEPLAIAIGEEGRRVIAEAGDDPVRASVPGWTLSGDSAYRAVDLAAEYFEYVGPGGAQYDVKFSPVGPGRGTYLRDQSFFSQIWRYVGPDSGDWVPRRVYPLPERKRLLAFWTNFEPADRLRIEAETAVSEFDRNTLSRLDDADNTKLAGRVSLALDEMPLVWDRRDLGTVTVSAVARGVQNGFSPMSRTTAVEDNRRWGLGLSERRSEERTAELATTYEPRPDHRFDVDLGWFDRDAIPLPSGMPAYRALRSGARYATTARGWPAMKLTGELINSRTTAGEGGPLYGAVRRGSASVRRPFWHLAPSARYEGELDERKRGGAVLIGSRYGVWAAELASAGFESFAASGSIERRLDERYDTTRTAGLAPRGWQTDQRALTQVWRTAIRGWRGLSATAEYTWRKREEPRLDATSISDVAEANVRYEAWDGLVRNAVRYRVWATQTARRERVYVYVGAGRGDFAPVNPDTVAILSESQVMEVPPGDPRASYALQYYTTDDFRPTVSLDASWLLNIDFTRVFRGVPDPRRNVQRPLWQRAMRIMATETSVQVSETDSTRNADLYLVKFWTFREPGVSPTMRGTWQLRQDLTLWPNASRGDLRLRVADSEDYDAALLYQRATPATTRTWEYSARGRLRFAPQATDWRGDLSYQDDRRSGSQFDYRAERILFDQTWAYHPTLQTEWSLRNEDGLGTDRTPDTGVAADPSRPLRAYLVTLEPGYRRAWGNRGVLRLTAQWSGVFGENLARGRALPVRLLAGRNTGHNLRWTALMNYRLSALVTASVTYTGRKTPGSPVIHSGRAEVRAVF